MGYGYCKIFGLKIIKVILIIDTKRSTDQSINQIQFYVYTGAGAHTSSRRTAALKEALPH